jgi:hypothetical protein
MLVGMSLCGFFMMVSCMKMVSVSDVRVMSSLLVVAFFMMLSRLTVVFDGVLQMLSGLMMVFCKF